MEGSGFRGKGLGLKLQGFETEGLLKLRYISRLDGDDIALPSRLSQQLGFWVAVEELEVTINSAAMMAT